MSADAVGVVVVDALELAAGAGAVVVDRAAVVVAEELATAVDVGEDALVSERAVAVADDGDSDGERRELADLVVLQTRGVGVTVLFAAGGGAEVAGAVTDDGNSDATRRGNKPGRRCVPERDGDRCFHL